MMHIAPALLQCHPDEADTSPLYVQVARKLGELVRTGHYAPDVALPPERVLSEWLNVSRVTARKALDQLVEQGLVVRRRGSGTYIAPQVGSPHFSEAVGQSGADASTVWLKRALAGATAEEQFALGLADGASVARVERLLVADGVVMAYEIGAVRAAMLPAPDSLLDSLDEHLARTGYALVRTVQHIRSMNSDAVVAGLLGLTAGDAVLFIKRVSYDASGQALELAHSYCRSDRYDFVVEMRRAR
ncbi:GntR family transcriptional regulator [Pseudoduganella sp. UC29_106]|uniref:GntR family transcriptional regulator n=1 Tax=Pseudoduganella sp. UC29_106 TaxID=3374553 RepID=UPI003756E21C